jgi:hypothetical protein
VSVIDVLRRDPRVQRIIEVTLEAADRAADRADDGGNPSRRTATVRCVFETVAGDPVALAVQGMVPGV